MIFISNIEKIVPAIMEVENQKCELLAFYKSTYEKLYSSLVNDKKVKVEAPIGGDLSGKELILKALNDTYSYKSHGLLEPLYYFDIRSSEDYSTPAPDYYILEKLGIKRAKALNIRSVSNVAFIHMLKMTNLLLKNKEDYVLASLSQRLDPQDFRGEEYVLADGAIAFTCKREHIDNEEGYYFEEMSILKTSSELLSKVSGHKKVIARNNKETMSLLSNTLRREDHLDYDFGVMDCLYTLEELRSSKQLEYEDELMLVGVENKVYTMIRVRYIGGKK